MSEMSEMSEWVDEYEDSWPGPKPPPSPPTERDGIKVGDKVTLVSFQGGEWPVEIVRFTRLPSDIVVRWLGLRPLSALGAVDGMSTICRSHIAAVRVGAGSR